MALVFDEYDAGRPDVMFVIQRVLEAQGKLTLLDQNRVIRPSLTGRLKGSGGRSGTYASFCASCPFAIYYQPRFALAMPDEREKCQSILLLSTCGSPTQTRMPSSSGRPRRGAG